MNRSKILLAICALLLCVGAALSQPAPAAAVPCFAYGICKACTGDYAKPCFVTQCGTQKRESCGSCQLNCVPPDA